MKPLPTPPAGEAAIVSYRRIADALAEIMGVPVSRWTVERLMDRRRNPLPVRGYVGKRWAFRSELVAWWATMDEYSKRIGRACEEMMA